MATAAGALGGLRRISLGHTLVVPIVCADGEDDVAVVILQLVGEVLGAGLDVEVLETLISNA